MLCFLITACKNNWPIKPTTNQVGRCWLKKSDARKLPSTKGSNSGQKSCGVTGGWSITLCILIAVEFFVFRWRHPLWPDPSRRLQLHIFSKGRLNPTWILCILGILSISNPKWRESLMLRPQIAHWRRTQSTRGTTSTQGKASRLETWRDALGSASGTASASSGRTIQGWIKNWLTLHRLSYTECPSAGLRLQTKEELHLQRDLPLDRKGVELQVNC